MNDPNIPRRNNGRNNARPNPQRPSREPYRKDMGTQRPGRDPYPRNAYAQRDDNRINTPASPSNNHTGRGDRYHDYRRAPQPGRRRDANRHVIDGRPSSWRETGTDPREQYTGGIPRLDPNDPYNPSPAGGHSPASASRRTADHNYSDPFEQPSWYDPTHARGSREPHATIDTSMENPRWYSNSTDDVYLKGHRPRKQRSKLPFIIAGGIIVLILVVFGITQALGAINTPQQQEQNTDTLAVSDSTTTPTTLTLTFAGDCTLGTDASFDPSTSFNAKYRSVGDPSYFMANVADIFGSDDYTVVNMEGTLTTSGERQDKTFAFKGPADYANILKAGNIEAASLANNHSHDYGDQSYNDTISALDDAGIVNFGYDRIGYADVKGVKVALIGTYELAEGIGIKDEMVNNINTTKDNGAQLVIVFTHWGQEKETVPDEVQVELGHAAIDAGADLVVGSHPHVIQGYEKYHGRYIVYSLGNFCFGGNAHPSDMDAMIFQQTFTVNGNDVAQDDNITVIPCSISSDSSINNYQPTPAEGDEKDRIMAKIEKSNDAIASVSAQVSGNSNANN